MNIKSRILEFLPKDLIIELNSICRDVLISDNNTKVNKMVAALDKYDVDYSELGPGTNRFAILIDGYVFKIAMDKDGIRDNLAEFSLSQELQPFVIKVYECNGLIIVTEYVTVISKEEFINSKDDIRHTLSYLAQGYLLGDVGSITKNFMNWGYRDDNTLVILDFAYIYRVLGEEMICGGLNSDDTICTEILEYDADFNKLICPKCRKVYTFHEIRRKISREYETKELETIKQIAYKVTEPNQEIDVKHKFTEDTTDESVNMNNGGQTTMSKYNNDNCFPTEDDVNYYYLQAMAMMKNDEESTDSVEVEESSDTSFIVGHNTEPTNLHEDDDEYIESNDSESSHESVSDEAKGFYSPIFIETHEAYDSESESETNDDNCTSNFVITIDTNSDLDVQAYEEEYQPESVEDVTEYIQDNDVEVIDEVDEEPEVESEDCETPEMKTEHIISEGDTIIITNDNEHIDEMRRALLEDTDESDNEDSEDDEYEDDYEDMYDEIRNDNINRKYSQKNKRGME